MPLCLKVVTAQNCLLVVFFPMYISLHDWGGQLRDRIKRLVD